METKQVIVIRKDLNMRKGKMVAQGAHASMKVFFDRLSGFIVNGECKITGITDAMANWMEGSFTKVCVYVTSEAELLAIYEKSKSAGIVSALIQDAGRTEFGGVPTYTAVAIGPDELVKVDAITGKLPLL